MTNADAGIAGAMGKTPGPKTPLAARVAAARALTGLNQTALSLAAGLARGHVGTIERGEVDAMTAETAQKLAPILKVSWQWLVSGEGGGPEPTQPAVADDGAEDDGRYPNRRVAAQLLAGRVDVETIKALRTMRLDSDRDLTVAEWATQARTLQEIRDGRTTAEPLDQDDAPRPKR